MLVRIIDRAANGLFHVLTDDYEIIRLYHPIDGLRIGDFIHTTTILYDSKRDDNYVDFIEKAGDDIDSSVFPNPFYIKCRDCYFRMQYVTNGCMACHPKKLKK